MYLVKTYLLESPVHGIGVFADQDIPKGTVMWRFAKNFDRLYTPAEVLALTPEVQEFLSHYSYGWKGHICFPADNDRFTNHADKPNTAIVDNGDIIALRDIKKHEEVSIDYRQFDRTWWEIFPDAGEAVA